ncbi:MAG: DsrE family protein [Pseudomonadota bacterium]
MLQSHEIAGRQPALAILLTEAPRDDVRGAAARRLVQALQRSARGLPAVYFYADAVTIPGDVAAAARWAALGPLDLAACPAAAERRGVDLAVQRTELRVEPLGLTAWLDRVLDADRVIRL